MTSSVSSISAAGISESSTGDIDLGGVDNDTNCDSAGTSAGNTAAARSGFYEINRIKTSAQAQLPANFWLTLSLTANMNISPFCNARLGTASR